MKEQGKCFFTDRGDEGGSVRWYTNTDSAWDVVEAELFITDCYKCLNLEFSANNNRGLKKRINKVGVLIDELVRFRDSLVKCEKKTKPFLY